MKTKHMCLWSLISLSIGLLSGCDGSSAETVETPEFEAGEEGDATPADAEEAQPERAVGDIVCEGSDVYMVGNLGVVVYLETCDPGLTCVEEEQGCACVPNCDGKNCGADGCGGTCGECPTELLCHADGVCKEDCLPDGDGKQVGNHIRNLSWQTPPVGGFSLHDLCASQEVIVIVEVAGW